MYVEFMENSYLADSSELMAVRVISVSWAQKRLIPTFWTWCTSSSWKILIAPIRASWWLLESFRSPEPKNVWFLPSRHDVRLVNEKFSSLLFERAIGYKTRFDPLSPKKFDSYILHMMYVELMKNSYLADSSELMAVRVISASWPKNVWFLLWRHDVRRVHEKFSSLRFERAIGYKTRFDLLSPKTFDSYFLDMKYVEFMKNFPVADSSELMAVILISASWAQKRLIPTFETWCTSSSWKIFFSPIQASWWLLEPFRHPEPKNVWFLLSRHDVRGIHEKLSSRRFERADGC